MVLLRSGQRAEQPPMRTYRSAFDAFKRIHKDEYRKRYPNIQEILDAMKREWDQLPEDQREDYEQHFQDSEKDYQTRLVLFYGGTKRDASMVQEFNKIPPKPKHPLNALFLYLDEYRDEYIRRHPDIQLGQATKELSDRYSKLSDKQKKPYIQEARKQLEQYHKDLDKWEEKYGNQFKEGQKKMKDQYKYHSQGRKQRLTYQEILSHKQRRKLVSLGNEETNQVGEKEKTRAGQKERQSLSAGRQQSRSPSSQNPKVQQEKKEKKAAGKGQAKN